MSAPSKERWTRLWRDASARGDADEWFDDLASRYSESHRCYHNLRHISECLAEFDAAGQPASQPVAVELAIWFHDVIYDPHATDNEEQSALHADRCLSEGGASRELRAAVTDLVLATKTHDGSKHADAPLLVDVDLCILGKPEDRFWEYEAQIRREYDWVPETVFASKRTRILERFLARERIYATDWLFERFEKQARSNLHASLQKLRSSRLSGLCQPN